jgi:hypothetical protein
VCECVLNGDERIGVADHSLDAIVGCLVEQCFRRHAGGGTRTPDTRIMIPLL